MSMEINYIVSSVLHFNFAKLLNNCLVICDDDEKSHVKWLSIKEVVTGQRNVTVVAYAK